MNPSTKTTRPRLRLAIWALVVGLVLGGQLGWLYSLRGPRILDNDRLLVGGQIALTSLLLAMTVLLATTPANAVRLRARTSVLVILLGTIGLNVAAIAWVMPALSEDLIRYRVDGATWLAGHSPYVTPPAQLRGLDRVDQAVTYPEVHTIYPPVSQLLFANLRLIENVAGDWLGHSPELLWRGQFERTDPVYRAIVYRSVFASLSIVAAGLLMAVLHRAGRSVWWAVLFCWNPLAIMEIAGQGHQDILGIVLVLLAIVLAQRERFLFAVAILALAAGVKPFAALLLPFLCRDTRQHRGMPYMHIAIAVFVVALAIVYLPIWVRPDALAGWLKTGQNYSYAWEANGSVYEWIKHGFGHGDVGHAMERAKQMARVVALAGLLLAFLFTWQARATLAEAGYWLFLALLLTSPVAYPWYVLWVLAMVPLVRPPQGVTGLVWAGTVVVCHALWHQPAWILPPWLAKAEYLPVVAALFLELVLLLKRSQLAQVAQLPIRPARI